MCPPASDVSSQSPSDRPTRLAAIVFTDIAGYSRMMEEDEERTIRVLRRHNEIVLPLIEQSGGEVIDAIGDGLFVIYPSVREAVICSSAIQEAVAAHNRGAVAGERFALRIGVHLGEIWREDNRVFGNGVNIAARVQPIARPGGICITEDVYRQVSNRLPHTIESIGIRELKNISRRMEIYRVVTGHEQDLAESDDGGELDTIKQRILQERLSVTEKRRRLQESQTDQSFEHRIESKVYSLVERVMDTAINKWDELPEEKKARTIARIQEEIEKGGKAEIRIDRDHKGERSAAGKKKKGSDLVGTGTVFGIGFGLGYFYFGIGWMLWPFILLGALPLASGLLRALKQSLRRRRDRLDRPFELERKLLSTARRLGGSLTVVQAASETDLPLDEVQATLDRMTVRGYVTQHIRDSGIVEYEFPSLARSSE